MEISDSEISTFQDALLNWAEDNTQQFPWRNTGDPYRILVSEFMLHRTRAKQVLPIYSEFINRFPTLDEFICSDKQDAIEILEPLGLNWRINNLINALIQINKLYGVVPTDFDKLINIQGIGQYIAGSTVCFAKNENQSLIDTNTLRVIGRYWGLIFAEKERKKKRTKKIVSTVTHSDQPKNIYYAIIDLAHKICFVKSPDCSICPLGIIDCKFKSSN